MHVSAGNERQRDRLHARSLRLRQLGPRRTQIHLQVPGWIAPLQPGDLFGRDSSDQDIAGSCDLEFDLRRESEADCAGRPEFQQHRSRRLPEQVEQSRIGAPIVVAEVSRAQDAAGLVLQLEQGQSGERHDPHGPIG